MLSSKQRQLLMGPGIELYATTVRMIMILPAGIDSPEYTSLGFKTGDHVTNLPGDHDRCTKIDAAQTESHIKQMWGAKLFYGAHMVG